MAVERDNQMIWDGQRRGHFEAWSATFNHRPSSTGFWIRHALVVPRSRRDRPRCQTWFAMFDAEAPERNVAFYRDYPASMLSYRAKPFRIRTADAELEDERLAGSVHCKYQGQDRRASWNLTFRSSGFTHRHLPDPFYAKPMGGTKILAPNPLIHLTGSVEVGQRRFELDGEPGCQLHTWGQRPNDRWAWAHCSAFREDSTASLQVLTMRPRRARLVTPKATFLSLYLGHEVYHFRDVWALPLTKGRWETGRYRFMATGKRVRVIGEFGCRPEDMVRARYLSPEGKSFFCHHTEVARATVTVMQRRSLSSPFRHSTKLTSPASAHFEYGSPDPDRAIALLHQRCENSG